MANIENSNKYITIAIFQKEWAFLSSIKKNETPKNLTTVNPIIKAIMYL